MLEVTPEDCAQLDDKQLRELVGLLCEAEMRKRLLPVSAVTWGGDQNAGDGGLDVRVSLPCGNLIDGFVPRASTGFQVKRQNMPPSAIMKEMRPNDRLRPVISNIVDEAGAYIIISSEASTSDAALQRRRNAMIQAVSDASNADRLFVDFYDRARLASWVRSHAGMALWVRQRVGRSMLGWEPYGPWAYPAEGTEAQFLVDEQVRIVRRPASAGSNMEAVAGLAAIRRILAVPKSVIRLIGLSGVGKTRLAQALFDRRVGTDSLDPTLAIYANLNNFPEPHPVGLASTLIADGSRAVLIIDNCGPELHRHLSETIKHESSKLSAITIEYDIREDQPEGSEVFEVKTASIDLTKRLLRGRFANISAVDAHTAAVEADGNARIAIAIASTIEKSGTLSGLSDEDIFRRLFTQRQQDDKPLLEMAQVLALVYSFQGEDLGETDIGEMHRLGTLIGTTASELFRATSELLDRELAQKRGVWRAILPHAIANRLAAVALRRIPPARIVDAILVNGSERLIKSFSRRLGYLHASAEARSLVETWFRTDGWLSNAWNLNAFGKAVFNNVLPVAPEAALKAVERSIPELADDALVTGDYDFLRRALRSLAYDTNLFGRALALLEFLCLYTTEYRCENAKKTHASLFYLYLSGTRAPVEMRLRHAKRLLTSADLRLRALGLKAIEALLEGVHFIGHDDFSFGARPRDYGYQPRNGTDVASWYKQVFALVIEMQESELAEAIRTIVADKFRGIWSEAWAREHLFVLSLELGSQGFWRDGWLAVKMTRYFDEKNHRTDGFRQLSELEKALAPRDLVQTIRARVPSRRGGHYDLDLYEDDDREFKGYGKALERRSIMAEQLGEAAVQDNSTLETITPELFGCEGELWNFGRGLARGATNLADIWYMLVKQLVKLAPGPGPLNINVLRGFLNMSATREPALAARFLEEAVSADPLASYFPALQNSVELDINSVDRLLRSIKLGKAPIQAFENLALGNITHNLRDEDFSAILHAISIKPNGLDISIEILHMRLFNNKQNAKTTSSILIDAGRMLLSAVHFREGKQRSDHAICDVIDACLVGPTAAAATKSLCNNLLVAIIKGETYAFYHNELITSLPLAQPEVVLDACLGGSGVSVTRGIGVFNDASSHHPNPIESVREDTLVAWCRKNSKNRFPVVAQVITLSSSSIDGVPQLSSIAKRLVEEAPDRLEMVRCLARRCRPTSWSGSRAAMLEANTRLLEQVDTYQSDEMQAFKNAEVDALLNEAATHRRWETDRDQDHYGSFE